MKKTETNNNQWEHTQKAN